MLGTPHPRSSLTVLTRRHEQLQSMSSRQATFGSVQLRSIRLFDLPPAHSFHKTAHCTTTQPLWMTGCNNQAPFQYTLTETLKASAAFGYLLILQKILCYPNSMLLLSVALFC